MGKRASKCTQLKVLQGNRSKAPLPKREPKPKPKAPKPPTDIDATAAKYWKQLAPKLERLGLLTEADADMFAAFCQVRSRLDRIHRELKKKGTKLVAGKKVARQNPLMVAERQYLSLLRYYAGEFGLSPRGRVGLQVGTDDDDDGLGELLD